MGKSTTTTKKKTPNDRIRETIRKHGLTRQQAAKLLAARLRTLEDWLRPETDPEFRKAPHWRAERFVLSTNLRAGMQELRAGMQELRAGRDMESED